jgi:hypothetical protein
MSYDGKFLISDFFNRVSPRCQKKGKFYSLEKVKEEFSDTPNILDKNAENCRVKERTDLKSRLFDV